MRIAFIVLFVILAAVILISAPTSSIDADNEALFKDKCTACHNTDWTCNNLGKRNFFGWRKTVAKMEEKGVRVDMAEKMTIANFLGSLQRNQATFCQ